MAAAKPKFKLGTLLNRGTFGKVYDILDDRGNIVGVAKLIKKDERGIPCMLEISIMQTYNHECLNGSLGITEFNNHVIIMQNKAKCDLQKEVKMELPSEEKHRIWCHRIAQGIDCLHDHGIIHCDMKPGNCLIFPNGDVKITDYTLSVLKKAVTDTFRHSIGTIPFCPPEVLLDKTWSKPVDIWSLGCTFYTLFTGQLLIPIQKSQELQQLDKARRGEIMKSRTLSAIISWRQKLGDVAAMKYVAPETVFNRVVMHDRWYILPEKIRQIILNMTAFDPDERPCIKNIVTDKYFSHLPIYAMSILSTAASKLDDSTIVNIERIVCKNIYSRDVLDLTKELYSRCVGIPNSLIKIETCYWIASKIITGDVPRDILGDIHEIAPMEKRICDYLNYHIHVKAAGKLIQSIPNL